MSIPRIPLNDGNSAPWLAFGTGTALYNKDAAKSIEAAIANGITHLDGAQMYNNEQSLGEGIKGSGKPRSELYVVTKLGKLAPGQSVKETLVESLKKFGLDYVDLFLIHSPLPHVGKLAEVWREFEALKEEGLTKSIGVSNFRVDHLEELLKGSKIVPAVNQIEYHPYVFKAAEPIIKFGLQHKIVTASYGGLSPIVRAAGGPIDPVLEKVRERLEKSYGKPVSTGQVLTKLLQQQNIIVVTTTQKEERVKEFLDIPNIPNLTKEEILSIEEAGSKLHKRIFLREVFNE